MRNPDQTYLTLRDRAEYMLANQICIVNGYRSKARSTDDKDFRAYNIRRMQETREALMGMAEMFDATFRGYLAKIELSEESDDYIFWIEAR